MTLKHLAIIDDYEHAAHRMADWSRLHGRVAITTFHDHLEDELALADRLKPYEIVWIMRERTPFPRSLLKRLPNLEHLLIWTGFGQNTFMRHAGSLLHELGYE